MNPLKAERRARSGAPWCSLSIFVACSDPDGCHIVVEMHVVKI